MNALSWEWFLLEIVGFDWMKGTLHPQQQLIAAFQQLPSYCSTFETAMFSYVWDPFCSYFDV